MIRGRMAAGVMLSLALSACVTTSSDPRINETVEFAKNICKYVPTAQTIAQILDLGIPNLSKALDIANAICRQVDKTGAGGAGEPKIHGVVIKGHFL
jgi:hypothetical protein